jgi:uncharacterized protein (DUF885 family)
MVRHAMRRTLPFALPVLALLTACAPEAAPPPASPAATSATTPAPGAAQAPATRVLAIADAMVDDDWARHPENVSLLRPPSARYDSLPDLSLSATAAREAREDGWLAELKTIDRASLGDTPAGLAYDIALDRLSVDQEMRVCKVPLWAVGQGWLLDLSPPIQVLLANLAEQQPVGTPDLRAQALARFGLVGTQVDTLITNLREGIKQGYAQADVNVRQVLGQLDALTTAKPEDTPFWRMAAHDPDPQFDAALRDVIAKGMQPALARYRAFLQDEYLPHARKVPGVSGNPNGNACYAATLHKSTTLPVTAKETFDLGMSELASVEGEMKALSAKSFGGADLRTLFQRFATDPAYRYKDAAAITAEATTAIARAEAAVPRVIGVLPKAHVRILPIDAYQEKTAAAHYQLAALDGSRPGTFRIRLYEADKQSTIRGEGTAFHEAVPGHHLQTAIATEHEDLPRIARFLFLSGYGEGWALYAERLADELGLYSSDAQRFGMLTNSAWRACRLVVDTGIHAFGWDRQKAIDFLAAHTEMTPAQIAQEVDRYISWPGQATSYMTGYVAIRRLRAEAEKALGAKFDLRAFHDCVLGGGNVPLTVLEKRVRAWIAARAKAS